MKHENVSFLFAQGSQYCHYASIDTDQFVHVLANSCLCAQISQNLKFEMYSPQKSSTSRKVPCSSNLCDQQSACRSESSSCPYSIEYLSDNTSSSGVLVEDLLYLMTEYGQPKIVTAPITFGYVLEYSDSFHANLLVLTSVC
jgi:hypothetical protein